MKEEVEKQLEAYKARQTEVEQTIDKLQFKINELQAEHIANQGAIKVLEKLLQPKE